jgi:hypothetical protein
MTAATPIARQLAALDELAGDLEARLLDAEELATAARVARRPHAERLSREDADVIRTQLALIAGLRAGLAEGAEGKGPADGPAVARKKPVDAQTGAGR